MSSSNPIAKAVSKVTDKTIDELKRAPKSVESFGSMIKSTAEDVGDIATKAATAVASTASDPGAWAGYLLLPGTGAGEMISGAKAMNAYQALNQAEKDKARAEAEARMKAEQERKAKLAQEKMVADKAKAEAAKAKERATRLGQGRRGLLYQGKETGVTGKSNVLGG